MSLATLFMPPNNPEELNLWSFAHAASHRDINRVILQTRGTRIDEYVLDPFDPADPGNWVSQHQVMHHQMNAALGLDGYDLSELDWRNEERLRDWIVQQSNEHYRVCALLGLG